MGILKNGEYNALRWGIGKSAHGYRELHSAKNTARAGRQQPTGWVYEVSIKAIHEAE